MRDISSKYPTLRTATARSAVRAAPATMRLLRRGQLPKGDPLPVARVAAIQAAKNTSQIIPYCHPIPVDFVGVEFHLSREGIEATVQVKAVGKTGVEMEALTAAAVAALTLYDMLKPVDDQLQILGAQLLEKTGGKSDFQNVFATPPRAAVLVMSDSIAAGRKTDLSGRLIARRLKQEGVQVKDYRVIPDDLELIERWLIRYADRAKLDLVITSGGTGLSPRDQTPEAMKRVLTREVPGIAEAARAFGQDRLPYAMLSRGLAGLRGQTLIVNLPGSRKGTADYLSVLFPAVLHAIRIVHGAGHPDSRPTRKSKLKPQ
jgi:cyclic pyranopterin monophosphate synthase